MTAPFECEVRFLIDDVEAFRRRIATLGGRVRFEYAFTDHYYRPPGGAWDPRTRALRVREHHRPAQPSEVLLTWTDVVQVNGLSFKRSRFPEGKVRLYAASADAVIPEPVAALVTAHLRPAARKVYFCGSIHGGRSLQPLYASIVDFLAQRGYDVLTSHVAARDVIAEEQREGGDAAQIYERDIRWLLECDLVIAEVSIPSLGVGVEVATAQHLGKSIICLCRTDVAL